MNALPMGWVKTTLDQIVDRIVGGGTPSKSNASFFRGSIPFMTVKDMTQRFPVDTQDHISEKAIEQSATTVVPRDTLIVATRMSLGKIVRPKFETAINQDLKALFLNENINKTFVEYWWRHKAKYIQSLGTGTTVQGIRLEAIRSLSIHVPPLNEQKHIADKLDTLLTRVDTCRSRLERIPLILKRFRQTVLAAATSGQLTEEWRDVQSLNKMVRWVSLEDVALEFSYGSSAKSSPSGSVPVLRMGNIQDAKLDWNNLVFTSDIKEIEKYQLLTGDILFNRTNSPELVGKTAVYKGERPAIYAGYLIRVRCSADLLPDYLNYCLNSPAGRNYCWQVKSDAISQSNINARKLAAFQFEMPPVEEQVEIVRRTEALLAYADRLEARYQAARTQVDRLTPALLTKAFRGELVPQDPNDEPASVLLERIRAERAAQPAKPKRSQASRKQTMTKMTEESVKEAIRQLPKDQFSFDELRENLPGDYNSLKDILFALLSEAEPSLTQTFDREDRTMCFVRAGK